jgi:hypothetical protein
VEWKVNTRIISLSGEQFCVKKDVYLQPLRWKFAAMLHHTDQVIPALERIKPQGNLCPPAPLKQNGKVIWL